MGKKCSNQEEWKCLSCHWYKNMEFAEFLNENDTCVAGVEYACVVSNYGLWKEKNKKIK